MDIRTLNLDIVRIVARQAPLHITNIYAEGKLSQDASCREFRQVRTEGTRQVTRTLPLYNLNLIISLGYRVKSAITTQFRICATERLREYLIKGFTMNDERPDGAIHVLRSNNITLSSNTLNFDDIKAVADSVRVRDKQWLQASSTSFSQWLAQSYSI